MFSKKLLKISQTMKKTILFLLMCGLSMTVSAKTANAVWYFLTQTSSSINEDENVQVKYGIYTKYAVEESSLAPYPVLRAKISNKTNKIVFVDLGTSYLKRNGIASPIYIPQSTSTIFGQNIGVSVNVGMIADAVGIGGMAGTLLGGVNVGGGKGSSTTTTTYAQRYVSIPPQSSILLDDIQILSPGTENIFGNFFFFKTVGVPKRVWCLAKKSKMIQTEQLVTYSENYSPFTIGVYLNYSLSEDFSNSTGMDTTYRVIKRIGSHFSTFVVGDKEFDIIDKKYPEWRSDVSNGTVEVIRLWAH